MFAMCYILLFFINVLHPIHLFWMFYILLRFLNLTSMIYVLFPLHLHCNLTLFFLSLQITCNLLLHLIVMGVLTFYTPGSDKANETAGHHQS